MENVTVGLLFNTALARSRLGYTGRGQKSPEFWWTISLISIQTNLIGVDKSASRKSVTTDQSRSFAAGSPLQVSLGQLLQVGLGQSFKVGPGQSLQIVLGQPKSVGPGHSRLVSPGQSLHESPSRSF